MNESQLFGEALRRPTPEERAAFLDRACANNPQLRADVEELLRALAADPNFLEQSPPLPDATVDDPRRTDLADECPPCPADAERPGAVLARRYRLMELIGEGGMGTVWMAQQLQPVRRQVAVKLIKPGMASRRVLARFEAERQALALMDHPNIARVFDGGVTPDERPFFVMELVRGAPITEFCDNNRLTTRRRLELFVQACQAIQHAHGKGVIHRDVKPSNVLVAAHDQAPAVKVIDFGIAKATGEQLTDRTEQTGFAQLIGTPLYMSPEQAGLGSLDVDTRSDVYSLGALLYELLTGTTPFRRETLSEAGYDEMRRIIREEEPPRPSARLNSLQAEERASFIQGRGAGASALAGQLRGELDWIVMKALEKDRARRYDTASELAADVQRYLNDEPVQACPPSAVYRLRKFAWRNKGALAAAAVVALAVLTAAVSLAASIGWRLREQAEMRGRTDGRVRAALAESWERQRQRRYPEALEAGRQAEAALAAGEGSDDLRAGARARLRDLEMLARLEAIYRRKGLMREALLGVTTLQAPDVIIRGRWPRPNGKWRQVEDVAIDEELTRAFEEFGIPVEQLSPREAGERLRETSIAVEAAAVLDDFALWRRGTGAPGSRWRHLLDVARAADPDPWRVQARDALERNQKAELVQLASGPGALQLPVSSQLLLAESLLHSGARDAMIEFLRKAQQKQPGEFWFNIHLGQALRVRGGKGDRERSVRYYAAAQAARPESLLAQLGLAGALWNAGDLAGAEAAYARATVMDPRCYLARLNLAGVLDDRGRHAESEAACKAAILLRPQATEAYNNLGATLAKQKKFAEAVAALKTALALNPEYDSAHLNLGAALRRMGEPSRAVAVLRKACRLRPGDFAARMSLAMALHEAKAEKEALGAFRAAFRCRPRDALVLLDLSVTLRRRGLRDGALTALGESIRLRPTLADAHATLGDALSATREWDRAIPAYRRAIELRPNYAQAHHNLGRALVHRGRIDEAIFHHREAARQRPGSVGFLLSLGAVLCDHKRDYEAAIRVFEKAVQLAPEDALARENLGTALMGKGDHARAIAAFEKALRLDGNLVPARVKLGHLYAAKRQHDAAIAAYSRALHSKPALFEARIALARAWRDKGNRPACLRAYRAALRVKPDDAQGQLEFAEQLAPAGRAADADAAFSRAISLCRGRTAGPAPQARDRSQLGAALNNFALQLARRKKPAEAARLLEEAVTAQAAALKAGPENSRYRSFLLLHYRNLADARLALGDHARAARAAIEASRLYPANWQERFRTQTCLVRCVLLAREEEGLPEPKRRELVRAYTRAVRHHAREAVKLCGNDPNALDSMAWFLANSDIYHAPALAVTLAEQAVELAPREAAAWSTLGAARYRAGAWKESVKALEQAMKLRKQADGQDMLFLAMAHRRLGDGKQARLWYDQAVKWMEKNKSAAEADECRFFQREAAALLEAGEGK